MSRIATNSPVPIWPICRLPPHRSRSRTEIYTTEPRSRKCQKGKDGCQSRSILFSSNDDEQTAIFELSSYRVERYLSLVQFNTRGCEGLRQFMLSGNGTMRQVHGAKADTLKIIHGGLVQTSVPSGLPQNSGNGRGVGGAFLFKSVGRHDDGRALHAAEFFDN